MVRNNFYSIFISYSKHDSWIAKQMSKELETLGAKSFLYETDTDIGDNFENNIIENIRPCSEIVVLFTPWSKDKKYIWVEIGAGLVLKKRIVSVFYGFEETEFLNDPSIPNEIKSTSLISLNEIDKYFGQVNKRILKIKKTKT